MKTESLSLSSAEGALGEAIREAGDILMKYWPGKNRTPGNPGDTGALGIQQKKDGSFVTDADFASNELLIKTITRLFPEDSILSEEVTPDPAIHDVKRVWIIDPLDGTKSFMDGNDDFSILVALVVDHIPELGFMYFPARDHMAIAKRGHGAYLNGRRLAASTSAEPRPESIYLRHCKAAPSCGIGPAVYPRWMDSGCAFLSVGRADFDGLVLKIVTHREWDLAAPAVVITESGGMVTDEHGRPITFNNTSMAYDYFVASNGLIHDRLLELIRVSERLNPSVS